MHDELERMRQWANEKLATGEEPPWAWYQYMKLRETLDAILAGIDSISSTANLQQSEQPLGMHLRLVDATYPQDTAQSRHVGLPVQTPM